MTLPSRARLLPAAVAAALAAAVLAPLPGATAAPAAPTPAASPGDPDGVWTAVSERAARRLDGLERRVAPDAYGSYHLDADTLDVLLDAAPVEGTSGEPALVSVPSPSGELVEFAVVESPVMEDGLAARHPDIRTWAGTATGDAPASIRLDVTPMGFHASVRGEGASWYVDPAYNGTDQGADALYLSYAGDAVPARDEHLVEPTLPGASRLARRLAKAGDLGDQGVAPGVGEGGGAVAVQRSYRLALVTDPSYAAYFTSSSDPAVVNQVVTAEKVTLMNRVNQVYGDDLSIRMLLVDGTDRLNFNTTAQFLGTNGRCGPIACYTSADVGCGDVIDTNRFVVGQVVGAESYDIGHIMFGPDGDGGGVAYLGSVGTDVKAGGCTGLAPPTGDGFAIDYVAHEMGHQFAGNHTFNGTSGSCSGSNREATTSVEPGSGTTIMAYAGICGVDNLQSHSDPYFSQRTQAEVAAFTRATPGTDDEIQNVALTGFGAGEAFTLRYGTTTSSAITSGSTYTAAGIKAAVEAAEPSSATATVTGLWGRSTALANGFQIAWSDKVDIATPVLTPTAGTFEAIVGTTDNGGPEDNQGYDNPAPTGNRNPVVTAPAARTIPIRTPFQLTGSGSDPDGDSLVYTWEQNDVKSGGGTALNSNTKASGPLFRVFGTYAAVTTAGSQQYGSPGQNVATSSPTRSFPDLAQVVAGSTNAATGACPAYSGTGTSESAALNCFSEFLPTTARTLNLRLTARDLSGYDGGTAYADTAITVGPAGPFLVTSQASASSVAGGSTGTVTWNVAGTGTSTYATHVKVSLSTDGGLTFPTVLAASTPNDGSETVTWPNVTAGAARIKVEAVDNYFYDVNDAPFTITASAPTLTAQANPAGDFTVASTDAPAASAYVSATSSSVAPSSVTASATGLPTGLGLTRTVSGSEARFALTGFADADPGSYPASVTVHDGAAADRTVAVTVVVTKDAAAVAYTGDTTGAGGSLVLRASVTDPDGARASVAGSVAFTDQATGQGLCSAPVAAGVASCSVDAPATRTYRVVGTLTSTRFTGVSAPTDVVVTVDHGVELSAPSNPAPSVQYSDALDAVRLTATSPTQPASGFTATATGLPSGVQLSPPSSSGRTATYTLSGLVTADPGEYPVVVTVDDDGSGPRPSASRSLTVTVTPEDATVVYTGPATVSAATFDLTAQVTTAADGTRGDVTRAPVDVVDSETGETLCGDRPVVRTSAGVGTATCRVTPDLPADQGRVYAVSLAVGGSYSGASDSDAVVTLSGDTTPPQTRFTGGPADGAVVLAPSATFRFTAEPGATYRCTLSGPSTRSQQCDGGSVTYRAPAGGSYRLAVVATDAAGNTDPTPATRTFHVPFDDRTLTASRGWAERSSAKAFRGTYAQARTRGATLTRRVSGATAIALVTARGRGLGPVDVYLGQRKLRRVSTAGSARWQVVTTVATFARPTSGTVRVVSRSGRPVRVDGLVVKTAVRSTRPSHVSRSGLAL